MGKIDVNVGDANQLVLDIEDIPMSVGLGVSTWLEERWQKEERLVLQSVFLHRPNRMRLILMRAKDARKLK